MESSSGNVLGCPMRVPNGQEGKQTGGPQHYGMPAVSKTPAHVKPLVGTLRKAEPGVDRRRPMSSRKNWSCALDEPPAYGAWHSRNEEQLKAGRSRGPAVDGASSRDAFYKSYARKEGGGLGTCAWARMSSDGE
jgi:hypothetical protein